MILLSQRKQDQSLSESFNKPVLLFKSKEIENGD